MDDFNPLVLLIPFIAGFIGWFTNWLAVKATLYPVEFVGIAADARLAGRHPKEHRGDVEGLQQAHPGQARRHGEDLRERRPR